MPEESSRAEIWENCKNYFKKATSEITDATEDISLT